MRFSKQQLQAAKDKAVSRLQLQHDLVDWLLFIGFCTLSMVAGAVVQHNVDVYDIVLVAVKGWFNLG